MSSSRRAALRVIETFSVRETEKCGQKIGDNLQPGDVICLIGELGAGKTAFVSGIAKALGIKEYITSPTFTIVNEYFGRMPLYHFDVYRIENPEELYDIGYDEYINGSGVSVIEWADRIEEMLPHECLKVCISIRNGDDENHRVIIIEPVGERYTKIVDSLRLTTGC